MDGSSSLHHPALMGPLVVLVLQVLIQVPLHLLDRLVPGRTARDAEVLVEQGAM